MTSPVTFLTAQRVIRMAYRDAGIIQEGDEPNGEQYADGLMRLNDLANLWQTQGLKLWTIEDLAVPLTAGQASYTLSPTGSVAMTKPLRVLQAYYLDSSSIRRPLVAMAWEEWTRLSQITQQGQINSYFVDKQQSALVVWFWLVPDSTAATGSAHLVIQQQVTQMVMLTDTTAFPMEWSMALRWGLADDLATGQPQAIMQRCEQRAKAFRDALEDWDVEDASTTFAPDQRSMFGNYQYR